MKIYYIANIRFPTEKAHGIQLAKMSEAMIEAGADLTVVVPNRGAVSLSPKDFYGLRVDLKVKRLPIMIDAYRWGRLGYYFSSLVFMLSYLFYFWWKRFINREKFIIYTADMDQFSFVFILLIGVPYFSEVHDAKSYSRVFAYFFKKIGGVITINHLIKDKLIGVFYPLSPEKIVVCPNGIDIKMFDIDISKDAARKKLELPLDKKLAIYTGQFYEWKGLEVFNEVAQKLSDAFLIYLVGGIKEEFMKVTGIKEVSNKIVFAGKRDYKEMPLWMKAADVLVVLGTQKNEYSLYHTSPMKTFEYMASKRPILGANTPAIGQILKDEEAFFYEPDNGVDMAEKIMKIASEELKPEDKIEASFRKVTDYSWGHRAEIVSALIHRVVRGDIYNL